MVFVETGKFWFSSRMPVAIFVLKAVTLRNRKKDEELIVYLSVPAR